MSPILLQEITKEAIVNQHVIRYESPPNILTADNEYSVERLCKLVEKFPPVMMALFELSYYEKLLGGQNRQNKTIYFGFEDFDIIKGAVPAIFRRTDASQVYLPDYQKHMYQVVVRGITQLGRILVKNMQHIPYELQRLYCGDCRADRQSKRGFYMLHMDSNGCKYDVSPFFEQMIKSRSISSIDVSRFTLQQCCEEEIIKFLLNQCTPVYLGVDIYPGTELRVKRVLWL